MKTIVVATDFSKNARNAALYALQLAQGWAATLVLLHVYRYPPENIIKAGDFPLSADATRDEADKALRQLAADLRTHAPEQVTIEPLLKEGNVLPTIQQVTRDRRADLLILSTVGTAPQSARFLGSVATEMIPLSPVPLLLIPTDVHYTPIKNVVLGINLNTPPNAVVLHSAVGLVGQFGAVVRVVCMNDGPAPPVLQERAAHIRQLLQPVPHTLTIEPGEDVFDTLTGFAQANKADLIMMLPQEHSWLARLFRESQTQRVARLTSVPVLAVV